MEALVSLLTTLNTLSPLAVIGLLATIIFMMVKGKTAADKTVVTIKDNHLHELPAMAERLSEIAETLGRMERKMAEDLSYIKAKINGK